jgi:hypothetical protein
MMKKEFLIEEEEGNKFLIEIEFDSENKPPKLENYRLEDYEDEEDCIQKFKDDFEDWETSIQYDIKKIFIIEKESKIKIKGILEEFVNDDEYIIKNIEKCLKSYLQENS